MPRHRKHQVKPLQLPKSKPEDALMGYLREALHAPPVQPHHVQSPQDFIRRTESQQKPDAQR